jgi:mRNA interferase MazF
MMVKRGEVWDINLNPVKGSEQQGFKPCVIISPDSMNEALQTVIVAPLTTKKKDWPTRVDLFFEKREGQVACEQIRTVSKTRFSKFRGSLEMSEIIQIKLILKQILFD